MQTILTALKDNTAFKKITDEELFDFLGHSVNDSLKPKADSSLHTCTQQSPEMTTCTSVNVSVCQEVVAEKNMEKERGTDDNNVIRISEVEENLIEPLSKYKDAAPLGNIDWVYIVDSGGQPQFHQVLPAFMHHTNLNIFVLRLCDKLSDCPRVTHYKNGTCDYSTTSVLSNKEILQSCAQATQTIDTDCNSRLIIVGTHKDQEHLCADETRQHKNMLLDELLLPLMDKYVMRNRNSRVNDTDEIMFSLNTKEPDATDVKVAEDLRQTILSMKTRMKPQPIPIKWLIFHQELQALSKKIDSGQLNFDQCDQVAKRLYMKQDTKAALMFFSDLNVILYYPEVLPDVIFVNPMALITIVTCIIKYIVYGTGCLQINDPVLDKARYEGMISLQLLEWMKQDLDRLDVSKVYKSSVIKEDKLLELLLHLRIICKSGDHYFMPSLLIGMDSNYIEKLLSEHPDTVAPCGVYYEEGWLECGTFGFLITSLLSSKEWKLLYVGSKLLCVHSNIIKMFYDSCNIVTFVDYVSHIEIHVKATNTSTCQSICPKIMWSVLNAFSKVKPLFTFICPCQKFHKHVAKFNSDSLKRKSVFCSRDPCNEFALSELGVEPLVWNISELLLNMYRCI